jgi:hypothetical protein
LHRFSVLMLPKQIRFLHPYLHATGLLLMVVGLPFSMLLMSLSQFFIGGNWILEGDYASKWKLFRSNKKAQLLTGLFLIYLPTVLWSADTNEALKMLRINLPLLIFPFVMGSSKPLPTSWYFALIRIFIASVLLAVIVCSAIGLPQWVNGTLTDIRHISLFISHIRFALLIVFAIFLSVWIVLYRPFKISQFERMGYWLVIVALSFFMVILQSLNGFFVLLSVGLIWGIVELNRRFRSPWTIVFPACIAGLASLTVLLLLQTWNNYFTPDTVYSSPLPTRTLNGSVYAHHFDLIENGHYINTFLCEEELKSEWPKYSRISIDSIDSKGHPIQKTLIRYLNSKGLTKDSLGLSRLTKEDFQNIEKGLANVKYSGLWGLRMRFYQLMFEYSFYRAGGENASGHSLLMKLEFWNAGLNILLSNPLTGVGIGDVPITFKQYYQTTNSWLTQEWWMTCHNQYLYMAVAGGIPLVILFLFFFLFPAKLIWKVSVLPFKLFIGIALLAMITEDMLTTQAGVSFIAFFYSFFAFGAFSSHQLQTEDKE